MAKESDMAGYRNFYCFVSIEQKLFCFSEMQKRNESRDCSAAPWWTKTLFAGASALLSYGVYKYIAECTAVPELHYCQTPRNKKLVELTPNLSRRYWPTIWATNTHVSTAVSTFMRSQPTCEQVAYRREVLSTPDGGKLAIDWCLPKQEKQETRDTRQQQSMRTTTASKGTTATITTKTSEPSEPPSSSASSSAPLQTHRRKVVVIVMAGLNGGSSTNYVMQMVRLGAERGWTMVAVNNRGTNATPLYTERSYCGSFTGDLRQVVAHVAAKHPDALLLGLGVSLGANILCKYMSEQATLGGEETQLLRGAAVLSNPWNFHESARALDDQPLYSRDMSAGLVAQFKRHHDACGWHARPDIDVDHVLHRTTSVHEFDEQVTRRIWGYDSVHAYFTDASSARYVHAVNVPLLAINALDDAIVPPRALPIDAALRNEHLIVATTPCGGHVGFPSGLAPFGNLATWGEQTMFQFLEAVVVQVDSD
jgi:predicted alpha/beta-fold hydrolase